MMENAERRFVKLCRDLANPATGPLEPEPRLRAEPGEDRE